jgi:hypothetical protein
LQFIERNQALIVGGDQVIQDFCFRSPGEADAIGKRPSIVRESFSDIPRTRSHGVTELLNAPVMALEVRRQQEQIDAKVEEMGELPGSDIAGIGGCRHARRRCNRTAVAVREESRVFHDQRHSDNEEFAMPKGSTRRNSFNVPS